MRHVGHTGAALWEPAIHARPYHMQILNTRLAHLAIKRFVLLAVVNFENQPLTSKAYSDALYKAALSNLTAAVTADK